MPLLMLPFPLCCENGKPYGLCRDCWEFNEAMKAVRFGDWYITQEYPYVELELDYVLLGNY